MSHPLDRHRSQRYLTPDGQPLAIAHEALPVHETSTSPELRLEREAAYEQRQAAFATPSQGSGNRAIAEESDAYRTCFERDLDRIQHSRPFRRLANKCQVFIAPEDDHLRTRLTHAIEVAQVATAIARPVGLNEALVAAAAMGHDCGHGPAGHASEEALSPFLPGGFHHAVYGADVVLQPLNLCHETLDAIRNHSWNRPTPATPEGEVVAWADRIAYVCHDFEDAVDAGIVGIDDLPKEVSDVVGSTRSGQLKGFVESMITTIAESGRVAMGTDEAEALANFRAFNYERIYLRPEARAQAERVIQLLRGLTEWFSHHPAAIRDGVARDRAHHDTVAGAVQYVSGMTDRFAMQLAVEKLGWDPLALPRGV